MFIRLTFVIQDTFTLIYYTYSIYIFEKNLYFLHKNRPLSARVLERNILPIYSKPVVPSMEIIDV